jgi:hypothetical protein
LVTGGATGGGFGGGGRERFVGSRFTTSSPLISSASPMGSRGSEASMNLSVFELEDGHPVLVDGA